MIEEFLSYRLQEIAIGILELNCEVGCSFYSRKYHVTQISHGMSGLGAIL
jgi:hypothetical protein